MLILVDFFPFYSTYCHTVKSNRPSVWMNALYYLLKVESLSYDVQCRHVSDPSPETARSSVSMLLRPNDIHCWSDSLGWYIFSTEMIWFYCMQPTSVQLIFYSEVFCETFVIEPITLKVCLWPQFRGPIEPPSFAFFKLFWYLSSR